MEIMIFLFCHASLALFCQHLMSVSLINTTLDNVVRAEKDIVQQKGQILTMTACNNIFEFSEGNVLRHWIFFRYPEIENTLP